MIDMDLIYRKVEVEAVVEEAVEEVFKDFLECLEDLGIWEIWVKVLEVVVLITIFSVIKWEDLVVSKVVDKMILDLEISHLKGLKTCLNQLLEEKKDQSKIHLIYNLIDVIQIRIHNINHNKEHKIGVVVIIVIMVIVVILILSKA